MLQILQIVRLHQVRLRSLRLRTRTTSAWRKQLLPRRTETVTCRTEFPCPENKAWLPVRSRQTVVTSTSGVFPWNRSKRSLHRQDFPYAVTVRLRKAKRRQSRSQRNFSERPVFSLTKLNTRDIMRSAPLICTGIVTLALMADAQIPINHRKAPQRTTKYSGYRGTNTIRQAVPRRTFSSARYRQPAFSTARSRQPTFRMTPTPARVNSSFANRPTMTNTAASRRTRPPVTNDWRESRFDVRPRSNSALVNRPTVGGIATHRQTRLTTADNWRESRFNVRPRPSDSVLNRFTMNDIADRPQTRREFNNKWSDANFRRQARGSFVNRPRSAAFWSGRRAAVTNNWRGSEFSGRQYWAFRNYERQWHDSGWWHHHCGDRIVFVTVYSQPFPFYFDAGYWYPAWGYYPDSILSLRRSDLRVTMICRQTKSSQMSKLNCITRVITTVRSMGS